MAPKTKYAIGYALLLLVAIVATIALPLGGKEGPAIVELVGRFHVLVLHVPIGVLVVALLAEALTFTKHRDTGDAVVGFALPLLVVTGVVAIVLGLCLGRGGDYPPGLLAKHRNFTLAGVVLAGAAGIAFPYRRGRAVHRVLLVAVAAVLGVGTHFGGSLTHGSDFLFPSSPGAAKPKADPAAADADAGALGEAAPRALEDAAAPIASDGGEEAASIDAGAIHIVAVRDAGTGTKPASRAAAQAVLLRRCAPCHTERAKGGLRVTDIGKMKAADVVPGQPNDSLLYTRLVLPKDDDDHMPPENQPQPTAAEIGVLRTWISELKAYP